jgi:hypothetical protein
MNVYVSPDGKDTGKGTKDDPFLTIGKAVESVINGTIYVMLRRKTGNDNR